MKMKLKKGDTVVVITGKDKGKQGTIQRVISSEGKIVVDGIGMVKRHLKGGRGVQQSGSIVERPRAIDASNVMFMDPKDKKPTRIGRKVENGKVVRFAKKSGSTLS
jgi:large subunit ribosomal protein L24